MNGYNLLAAKLLDLLDLSHNDYDLSTFFTHPPKNYQALMHMMHIECDTILSAFMRCRLCVSGIYVLNKKMPAYHYQFNASVTFTRNNLGVSIKQSNYM